MAPSAPSSATAPAAGERSAHVAALISEGFRRAPAAAGWVMAAPWEHVADWLHTREPEPRGVEALVLHLDALGAEAQALGPAPGFDVRTAMTVIERVAEWLMDRLTGLFAAAAAIGSEPADAEVERLVGAIAVCRPVNVQWLLSRYAPPARGERSRQADFLRQAGCTRAAQWVDDIRDGDGDPAGALRAAAAYRAALLVDAPAARIAVPLVGSPARIAELTIVARSRRRPAAGSDPAASARRRAVRAESLRSGRRPPAGRGEVPAVGWHGVPVGSTTRAGADRVIAAAIRLLGPQTPPPSRIDLIWRDHPDRPLVERLREIDGRSWELGGLLALVSALTGAPLGRAAASGELSDGDLGQIGPVAGIAEKVEALAHCRDRLGGPAIQRLHVAARDASEAVRAVERAGAAAKLDVIALRAPADIAAAAGSDPWAAVPEPAPVEPRLTSPAEVEAVGDWRSVAQQLIAGDRRAAVTPAPFGCDLSAWTAQMVQLLRAARADAAAQAPDAVGRHRLPVPVTVPAAALTADDPRVALREGLRRSAAGGHGVDVDAMIAGRIGSPDRLVVVVTAPRESLGDDLAAATGALARQQRLWIVVPDAHALDAWTDRRNAADPGL
jgi:hypothetical protein